jgi:hypothetical protein
VHRHERGRASSGRLGARFLPGRLRWGIEVVSHGWPALVGALLFLAAPVLMLLIGASRRARRGLLAASAVPG